MGKTTDTGSFPPPGMFDGMVQPQMSWNDDLPRRIEVKHHVSPCFTNNKIVIKMDKILEFFSWARMG